MNKKLLTEADIRTKFITPAIAGEQGEKWDVMTQVREEVYFTVLPGFPGDISLDETGFS
jgi:type I restriction enzyme R subunit